eukprot:6641407-Prymnesium_polylepis.1
MEQHRFLLSQLGSDGSAEEQLLSQLNSATRFLYPLVINHRMSLVNLLECIRADDVIKQELRRSGEGRFHQIADMQKHMNQLNEWLKNGLGGLEAVFVRCPRVASPVLVFILSACACMWQSQYKAIYATGRIDFRLQTHELHL